MTLTGNIADWQRQRIYFGELQVENGRITSLKELGEQQGGPIFIPGFIDSHVHIESSMLVPSEFAKLAVVHGTVATISDPHEIANVCGLEGVQYMIENGKTVPFKFHFGAPSCVPATTFETAGAALDSLAVDELLRSKDIFYLSEMMNFPGVLNGDEEVMKKIASSRKYNKPVDGHAPGLRGAEAKKYIDAGISTDHECFTREEALDKLSFGMKILIREGSAARNFEALIGLLNDYPERIMFCSDDKHPDSLVVGHINLLCARAVAKGINAFAVIQAACINPVLHYRMDVGLLRKGDPADFILINDLLEFSVLKTWINGQCVAEKGVSAIVTSMASVINNFFCERKTVRDLIIKHTGQIKIPVIEALDGQLITNKIHVTPCILNDEIVADLQNDVLKIVVVNRYQNAPVARAFIKNIGLKKGAIASSVAHDSHNIVAVGVDDESICRAINLVIEKGGGISCTGPNDWVLALPVGGLMSNQEGYEVARQYTAIDAAAKELGSRLSAPFMTLSFMALLVIPHLKLSDKGLFDGDEFRFIGE